MKQNQPRTEAVAAVGTPAAEAGLRQEKAHLVGNCVNSFDESGRCVVPQLPFGSVSDFACAEEGRELLERDDFLERVAVPDDLLPLAMREGTLFLDLGKRVLALHEVETDIHYFFVEGKSGTHQALNKIEDLCEVAAKLAFVDLEAKVLTNHLLRLDQLRSKAKELQLSIAMALQQGADLGAEGPGQTDTPEFKAWFAESAAVNSDGTPRRFFHGTATSFAAPAFHIGSSERSRMVFFTPCPDEGSSYAERDAGWHRENDLEGAPQVIPVYLSVQRPFDPDNQAHREALAKRLAVPSRVEECLGRPGRLSNYEYIEWWANDIMAAGFDGVWLREHDGLEDDKRDLAVFDPCRVKSAIGNCGAFDPACPDITR